MLRDINQIVDGIFVGNKRMLSKGISLVESTLESDANLKDELLARLRKQSNPFCKRVGITGSPGVGKSTLIESLGLNLIEHGEKIAVLAVDPSSVISGGSILGDKVRMPELSRNPNAFIRPTASSGSLGGVSRHTRMVIELCEHFGCTTIIVETVGVGQSEIEVANLVDFFLLLVLPNSGDDVQGIKRGIMEMADALVVTKSDVNEAAAMQSVTALRSVLSLLRPKSEQWKQRILQCSAVNGDGVDFVRTTIEEYFHGVQRIELVKEQRREQLVGYSSQEVTSVLKQVIEQNVEFQKLLKNVKQNALNNALTSRNEIKEVITKIIRNEY